jgi:hypothetical protein
MTDFVPQVAGPVMVTVGSDDCGRIGQMLRHPVQRELVTRDYSPFTFTGGEYVSGRWIATVVTKENSSLLKCQLDMSLDGSVSLQDH